MNIAQPQSESLLRNCVWALSNFCRGKPQPALEVVAPALPALAHLLTSADKDVLTDAGWAVSYLSDGNDNRIETVVGAGVIPPLVAMLQHPTSSVVTPALRSLGNIVTGTDSQTQAVIDNGVIPILGHLLSNPKKSIRKEACWTLSNIAAGNPNQMAAMCKCPGEEGGVIQQMAGSEWDVQKEAAWVVSNVATASDSDTIARLCSLGVIKPIVDLLNKADSKIVLVMLEALEAILKTDDKGNYAIKIDEADGLDAIENLQEHENEAVYEKAVHIIETYFGENDEDENLAPNMQAGSAIFNFGVQPAALPATGFNFAS
ncbi:unnamed protein product [Chrysoparadoxa australica]